MTGRRVVVVANLLPKTMAGFESQGMVLCANGSDGKVEFIDPPPTAAIGERVTIGDLSAGQERVADLIALAKKGNAWSLVAPVRAHVGGCVLRRYARSLPPPPPP
jgi:tRNA-binding EMAP/Myf-like protein